MSSWSRPAVGGSFWKGVRSALLLEALASMVILLVLFFGLPALLLLVDAVMRS